MTEDTVGFQRRENSDLRLEVEHLREKTELMGQELAVLRERDFLGRLLEERPNGYPFSPTSSKWSPTSVMTGSLRM